MTDDPSADPSADLSRPSSRWSNELFTASRFAIVGGVSTLIHMSIVWVLASVYGLQVFVANLIAFACAFTFSFVGHHWWTFRSPGSARRRLVRFSVIAIGGFAVNSVVLSMVLWTGLLAPANAALVAVAVVPVLSFVFSRLWGFNERR